MPHTIEEVRERFENTPELMEYLPMLEEYIFSDERIGWLCVASVEEVAEFCFLVDE